jgi:hypothetical protein
MHSNIILDHHIVSLKTQLCPEQITIRICIQSSVPPTLLHLPAILWTKVECEPNLSTRLSIYKKTLIFVTLAIKWLSGRWGGGVFLHPEIRVVPCT